MNILQRIFRDHYEEMLYILHPRKSVIETVDKMLNCGDPSFGGAMYFCPDCGNLKFIPFRCHSRFCPTCGNKYSINRITSMSFKIINVRHRHCVFTIAEELRSFFLKDRSLLNCLFSSVRSVVMRLFHKDNKTELFTPGFICVLHTFGRDQKLIVNMEKQLEEKASEIKSKDKEINELKNQLAYLQGQILNKNRKIFGKSSEQVDSNQISIFDEAEKNSNPKIEEPTIEEVVYKRAKPSKNTGKKDNLANLERVVIEHKLSPDESICSECNSELDVIGKKTKEVLKYVPATLYIEDHVMYSYACKACEAASSEANIDTTKGYEGILYKSMASNELVAHVLNIKYHHATL